MDSCHRSNGVRQYHSCHESSSSCASSRLLNCIGLMTCTMQAVYEEFEDDGRMYSLRSFVRALWNAKSSGDGACLPKSRARSTMFESATQHLHWVKLPDFCSFTQLKRVRASNLFHVFVAYTYPKASAEPLDDSQCNRFSISK